MAVQGICWAKMFHLRVEVVAPSVCVNEIVSVEVAPNSTYTGKVRVIVKREKVKNKTHCGSQCWCRRWRGPFFQFGLNCKQKIKNIFQFGLNCKQKIKSVAEVNNKDWHLMQ